MEEKNSIAENSKLRFFTYIYKVNCTIEGFIALFLLIIMTVIVFGRYIFKIDLNAADEYLYFALVWSIFMGGAAGSYEKSFIKADTIATLVKNKTVLKINKFLNNTLNMIIVTLFLYYSYKMVKGWFELKTYTSVHRMPFLIGYSAVFYGGIMMFLYTLFHYISYIRDDFILKKQPEEPELETWKEADKENGGEG